MSTKLETNGANAACTAAKEEIAVQLGLPIPARPQKPQKIRSTRCTHRQSVRLENDPLGPSYLRRAVARGYAPKGITAYRYQLEAMLKIAEDLVGKATPLERIFGNPQLLGKVLTSDIAPNRRGQISKWTLAQRRSAARSFATLVGPELRDRFGCDPHDRIDAALRAVAERVGGGYRLGGGAPRRRGGYTPPAADVRAMIEAAGSAPGYRGFRNRAFFGILARTGTRINALRMLDGRDCVLTPSGRTRLYVYDKGKAEPRELELDRELAELLEVYVASYNLFAAGRRWGVRIGIGVTGPIWRNSHRGAWPYAAIDADLHQACNQANVEPISPHALRRAFATDAARLLPRHVVALAGGWQGLERLDDHYVHPHSSDIWRKLNAAVVDHVLDDVHLESHDNAPATPVRS